MARPTRARRSRAKADGGAAGPERWQGLEIESRRLLAELWGAFLLTLVACGGAALHKTDPQTVSAAAAVVAPAAMVLAVIYFMGAVSGAHVNPAVTLAFALRRNFPWIRVPGYIAAQLMGAVLAAAFLAWLLGPVGELGSTSPRADLPALKALVLEAALTTVLVNTILGTASQAGFLGPNAAIPVGSYIALAGLWAGSLTGASMNPARSIGPDLVRGDLSHTWIYVAGPLLGALAGVALEWALKGPPSRAGARAAQGEDEA
ncbi:MAG: aquaporin [Caulobacteraceae bacterium]|nr:aquaporin [Caulobacteraceae bacterium]